MLHILQIVDFHNSVTPADEGSSVSKSEQALQHVLQQFDSLQRPVLHMLGNHCLYNHPRDVLNSRLGPSLASPRAKLLQRGFCRPQAVLSTKRHSFNFPALLSRFNPQETFILPHSF